MVLNRNTQEQLTSQIGLIPDFAELIQYLSEANNLSDNPLQIYNPSKDKYLQWISNVCINTFYSSPVSELEYVNSKNISNANIIPISTISFDDKYKNTFFEIIQNTIFEAGEDNVATIKFAELILENKDASLKLICDYFVESFKKDERMCVKILSLLSDYSYKELYPYSQTIALASLSHKSSRVKSAAYNMFAHWGNSEALSLLKSVGPPVEPWIRKKYYTIKATLEERCCMLVK